MIDPPDGPSGSLIYCSCGESFASPRGMFLHLGFIHRMVPREDRRACLRAAVVIAGARR